MPNKNITYSNNEVYHNYDAISTIPAYKDANLKFSMDQDIALLRQRHITNPTDMELFTQFRRYPTMDPYNYMGTSFEYVFFTKPNLQLLNGTQLKHPELASNIIQEAYKRYFNVLTQLQWSYSANLPFNTLLFNTRSASIDLPDITVSNDYETAKNNLGSSIYYRGTSYESDENYEFSVEFTDTRNIDVYMWFKVFDEYERLKHLGKVSPLGNDSSFAYNKTIHDQFSVYRFIVAEDGESIIHYSKFTGVYPKQVPRAAFSDMPADGQFKFTVNFKANFVEDLEPIILYEFNRLCDRMNTGGNVDTYNYGVNGYTGDWMLKPCIVTVNPGNARSPRSYGRFESNTRYKLKWYSNTPQQQ